MFPGVDKAVEALHRGQESAKRLKTVLEYSRKSSSVPTEPLFDTILDSFSVALSFIPNFTFSNHDSSQSLATLVARKSLKRKINGKEGLEHHRDDSPNPLRNDGFVWRKYGQKNIKTSLYQRCYYRCAYGKEQNCNATKRVQQIQDNPSVFRTTYVGKHICDVSAFSQANGDEAYGSKMIQFEKFIQAAMPEPVMPPFDHQAITNETESVDDMINQEFDDMSFLDDLPDFDYSPNYPIEV